MRPGTLSSLTTLLAGTCLVFAGGSVAAQVPGTSGAAGPGVVSDPGFLFERPRISVGIRGGWFFHRGDSDLYDFATERFTVEPSDFRSMAIGVEGAVWLGNQAEFMVAVDGSRLSIGSEYRDWVEEVPGPGDTTINMPIRQTTRLSHGPAVSFGIRWYLLERGEQLSRFVWIPAGWNAYVGGGGGVTGYRLQLEGDFVDENEGIIRKDRFASSGSTAFPWVMGGIEMALTTRTALTFEGRYQWGDHDLGPEFADFEHPLDLAGSRFSIGLNYRF
jgi:hypothetical protein